MCVIKVNIVYSRHVSEHVLIVCVSTIKHRLKHNNPYNKITKSTILKVRTLHVFGTFSIGSVWANNKAAYWLTNCIHDNQEYMK